MSGSYVFKPGADLGTGVSPYLKQYAQQPPPGSPLIPPTPGSPYSPYHSPYHHPAGASPYVTPMTLDVPGPDGGYYANPYHESRPRSWHAEDVPDWVLGGGGGGGGSPVRPPVIPGPAPPGPYLAPPMGAGHARRHSFGGSAPPPAWAGQGWSPAGRNMGLAPEKVLFHPWLDGARHGTDLYFDLAAPTFAPRRRTPDGKVHEISPEQLEQPATHPPTTAMTITLGPLAQWPIDLRIAPPSPLLGMSLEVPSWAATPPSWSPPITLRDVLEGVYRHVHQQISHDDWARLAKDQEAAVSRAYTRRTRSAYQLDKDADEVERGVKRVDYLLDQFMFRGLRPVKGSEGVESVEVVLSRNK
jgi:hypothetical protein